jgi:hypothetical protein
MECRSSGPHVIQFNLFPALTGRATNCRPSGPIDCTMAVASDKSTEAESRRLFLELKPGDKIEVDHTVIVGSQRWQTTTAGTVVRIERRRHGLHFRRNYDDKVYSDIIILTRPDGELTTVTMDEFTRLRRV